jgi:hypothetical protein
MRNGKKSGKTIITGSLSGKGSGKPIVTAKKTSAQKAKETKSKPAKAKPKKPKYKDNIINRIKEDWSQPIGGYNYEKGTTFPPAYDKYPYGSLTGRGKNKKKKK